MNTGGQRGLWMIAVVALLGAIGYIALRPPSPSSSGYTPSSSAEDATLVAPGSSTARPPSSPPATEDADTAAPGASAVNPFTQSAPVPGNSETDSDWAMEGLNPARTRAVATPVAPPLDRQRIIVAAS